jgi:hypothetical protein
MAKSLLAKQAYQVQTGGAQSVALPFGWTKVLIASPGESLCSAVQSAGGGTDGAHAPWR